MKKVLLFLLILAVALGGLGFAHAAVTAGQEDILIYPTLELGSSAALDGRSVDLTFSCGDHLRWHCIHTFGGETETTFEYSREGFPQPPSSTDRSFDMWFTGDFSTSTNGSISFRAGEYGALINAVAAETPTGERRTASLLLKDYVNYYVPDYNLTYEDDEFRCFESASLLVLISEDNWYEEEGCYHSFLERFNFPVQEDQIMSVTVEKNSAGAVSSLHLSPENGPVLYFLSDVTAEGIWFVPIFRDEQGTPLPYESPQGHGIYFAPWKTTGSIIHYGFGEKQEVTPDLDQLRLVYPLEEDLIIETIRMDSGKAWLLTRSDSSYTLSACDLATGETTLTLEVLPHDPTLTDHAGSLVQEGNYLLITAQQRLALVDALTGTLLLTAPDADQRYKAAYFNPATGDLRYDGQQLTLIDASHHYDGTFWVAAYTPDALGFYAEYDSTLLRGNDSFYYSLITLDPGSLTLH